MTAIYNSDRSGAVSTETSRVSKAGRYSDTRTGSANGEPGKSREDAGELAPSQRIVSKNGVLVVVEEQRKRA